MKIEIELDIDDAVKAVVKYYTTIKSEKHISKRKYAINRCGDLLELCLKEIENED